MRESGPRTTHAFRGGEREGGWGRCGIQQCDDFPLFVAFTHTTTSSDGKRCWQQQVLGYVTEGVAGLGVDLLIRIREQMVRDLGRRMRGKVIDHQSP